MALVQIENQGDSALVRFRRPPVNAFNLAFVEDFHRALTELAAEVPAAGVVVTGDGHTFSGGVDVKQVPAYTAAEQAQMVNHINAAITLLYGLPTATVAAVNGAAIGGAFVVMLACDARVAARGEAKLALTEVTAGVPYPACPMEVVKAEIETGLRRHLVLTGEATDPERAHAQGLIDELAPPEALLDRALELARTRAAAPAYARVKAQLRAEALSRMREIVAGGSDPMLEQWT